MNGPLEGTQFPKRLLRLLYLEDDPTDFELSLHELRNAKLEVAADLVETREEFCSRLGAASYDLVLADYKLPTWTGIEALELLRQQGKDIPLILVTGTLGEEMAVECIKRGASEYVLKDRLERLPAAVRRALEEGRLRQERLRAEASLRSGELTFRRLADSIASAVFIYQGTACRYANRAAEVLTGYSRAELLNLSSWDLIHPDSRKLVIELGLAHVLGGQAETRYEMKILTKHGEARWLDCTVGKTEFEGKAAGLTTAFDTTERRLAEEGVLRRAEDDPLTGLLNASSLAKEFAGEAKRSERTGRSFAVLILDIVAMDRINEVYGSLAGSRALCRVANALRMNCRGLDIAARYGGDEFAVILPETATGGAQQLSRRVSEKLTNDGEQPALSLSAGIAVYPRDGETFEGVLHVANRNLSQSRMKGTGKLALSA